MPPPPAAPPRPAAPWDPSTTRTRLEELAAAIGFDALALAGAGSLNAPNPAAYREFLDAGFSADMQYLGDHPEARINPTTRWPWARSVLVLGVHYDRGLPVTPDEYATGASAAPSATNPPRPVDRIARYARGHDYHRAVENALRLFKDAVVSTPELGIAQAHYHCDTGPVLERPWAQRAGLGWQAKNGLLIRPGAGSFLFLAELFLDRALPADAPATDHCGACTRCIDACPTEAIVADRVVDPRKCIPWMNIEKRAPLTPAETPHLHGWLFGCDVCQNVCPHNSKVAPLPDGTGTRTPPRTLPRHFTTLPVGSEIQLPWYHQADRPLRKVLGPELWEPSPALQNLTWEQAAALTPEAFDKLKRGTALRRVPYENFIANAKACAAYWQARR